MKLVELLKTTCNALHVGSCESKQLFWLLRHQKELKFIHSRSPAPR